MSLGHFHLSSVLLISVHKLLAGLWLNLASWHGPWSSWGSSQDLGRPFQNLNLAWFSRSFTTSYVCLGLLPCRNTQLHPRPDLVADDFQFSRTIWRLSSFFIIPFSFFRAADPLAAQQPHSIMLPAPCPTVGLVFWGFKASPSPAAYWGQTTQFLFQVATDFSSRRFFLCPYGQQQTTFEL